MEPRSDSPQGGRWPAPSVTRVINGSVRIPNMSNSPIFLSKNQHFGQINRVVCVESISSTSSAVNSVIIRKNPQLNKSNPYSDTISIDPGNQLSNEEKEAFKKNCRKYDSVFSPEFGGYNDHSGSIRAHLSIGSIPPPPQKARMPFYNQRNLQLLQEKADELEMKGVLVTPESVDLVPKHESSSFLVKKPNGDWRFVTAFNDLGKFCRLPPSKITKCNDILQKMGSFKFIIKTDLTSSFFPT